MMRAFEAVFPQVSVTEDDQRRRRWHLPRSDPRWLQALVTWNRSSVHCFEAEAFDGCEDFVS
jgi:hypothetical protein